jgi:D-serine deaminase-like pyridoxal phosphate-dependent protein
MAQQKTPYSCLDTPALLLDLNKLEANIKEMQRFANKAGVKLRPHIKVHESAAIAKVQVEAGACGVEVGPLAQAEAMAEEGFHDIVVVHPFYGEHKLELLRRLISRPWLRLTVTVDMIEQAKAISQVGQAVGRKVPVLIKIDIPGGLRRFGVLRGEPAVNFAKKLGELPAIELEGIYAHEMGLDPTPEGVDKSAFEVASAMCETARMLRREGITIKHVSVGASPTFRSTCRYIKEGQFPEITEIHPGSWIIGDINYVRGLGTTLQKCALTILATVVSTSQNTHAVIDCGAKTLGGESLISYRNTPGFFWQGKPSYGLVQGRPDLWLGFLCNEVSIIYYTDPKKKLRLGERIEIVPNGSLPIINSHDCLYGVRKGEVERVIPVTGRGRGY